MQLVIIRHAIAEQREIFAEEGKNDSLRPLTNRGRKRMKENLRGITRVVPSIQLLASSELTRAIQTAEIVHKAYAKAKLCQTPTLNPETAYSDFLTWLRSQTKYESIAVVGHEPHLGELISYLVHGNAKESYLVKKGSLAVLHFHTAPIVGTARLQCLIQPASLRQMGNANFD